MDNKELKHYLSILVELQLYPMLQSVKNDSLSTKEKNKIQQDTIIKFIDRLPEQYKNMSGRDEIIASVLQKMNVKTAWGEKKLEEDER